MFDVSSFWFWFTIGVLFLLGEIAVTGTFSMMILAVVSLVVAGCTFFVDSIVVLCLLYGGLAILGVLLVKPVLQKTFRINETVRPSTIEAMIGKTAVVLTAIPADGKGTVKVGYEEWSARTKETGGFAAGESVSVLSIDGTTLWVGGVSE